MAKCYIISRSPQGVLAVLCQSLDKNGKLVEVRPSGKFDSGNPSEGTQALALAIMQHYFGDDPGAQAEATRKAGIFQDAFILSANIPEGGQLEISGDVVDRWLSLL